MEYKKENGKFSFGIGTEKVAGKGNLSETESESTELAKIIVPMALTAGAGLLKNFLKQKHRKK